MVGRASRLPSNDSPTQARRPRHIQKSKSKLLLVFKPILCKKNSSPSCLPPAYPLWRSIPQRRSGLINRRRAFTSRFRSATGASARWSSAGWTRSGSCSTKVRSGRVRRMTTTGREPTPRCRRSAACSPREKTARPRHWSTRPSPAKAPDRGAAGVLMCRLVATKCSAICGSNSRTRLRQALSARMPRRRPSGTTREPSICARARGSFPIKKTAALSLVSILFPHPTRCLSRASVARFP